jgi:membrane-anchored protein YejM (alkaline phosphatase superfamily)
MKSYVQLPVLWLAILNLVMSLLIDIDVAHAASVNPIKSVYGKLYLTAGLLGISVAVTFRALFNRIAALEARVQELAPVE